MKSTSCTLLLALVASACLTIAPAAEASQPKFQVIEQGWQGPQGWQNNSLPKFGFRSYNIHGIGERVTFVRWNGLARQLGLERGDTILAMNNYALTYHGAWRHALRNAMYEGGFVQLAIWDVRTGSIVYRDTYLGSPGFGPITPKSNYAYHGPMTTKSYSGSHKNGPKSGQANFTIDLSEQLEKLTKLKD